MSQTVLVIDDSPDTHELLRVRLKPENVELHHATDAEDGMLRARELRPDLILLDVDMPNMTGFEVCQRLKLDPTTSGVPVIFLTGASEVHAKVQGFDLGAVDYVTKPFQPAELRARVRAALRTKRYQDMLATRAQLDALTGLWNRGYFDQRLADEIEAVKRYDRAVSLVMVDLDHFKSLNDTYGHPFGDQVLQRVGEILSSTLRAADAPARYGGEEFGVILTETDVANAQICAQRIQDRLSRLQLMERGKSVPITASFGIASSESFARNSEVTARELVRLADDALYEAKRTGRNRIVVRGNPAGQTQESPLTSLIEEVRRAHVA